MRTENLFLAHDVESEPPIEDDIFLVRRFEYAVCSGCVEQGGDLLKHGGAQSLALQAWIDAQGFEVVMWSRRMVPTRAERPTDESSQAAGAGPPRGSPEETDLCTERQRIGARLMQDRYGANEIVAEDRERFVVSHMDRQHFFEHHGKLVASFLRRDAGQNGCDDRIVLEGAAQHDSSLSKPGGN